MDWLSLIFAASAESNARVVIVGGGAAGAVMARYLVREPTFPFWFCAHVDPNQDRHVQVTLVDMKVRS